jgi:hypothetical protein
MLYISHREGSRIKRARYTSSRSIRFVIKLARRIMRKQKVVYPERYGPRAQFESLQVRIQEAGRLLDYVDILLERFRRIP